MFNTNNTNTQGAKPIFSATHYAQKAEYCINPCLRQHPLDQRTWFTHRITYKMCAVKLTPTRVHSRCFGYEYLHRLTKLDAHQRRKQKVINLRNQVPRVALDKVNKTTYSIRTTGLVWRHVVKNVLVGSYLVQYTTIATKQRLPQLEATYIMVIKLTPNPPHNPHSVFDGQCTYDTNSYGQGVPLFKHYYTDCVEHVFNTPQKAIALCTTCTPSPKSNKDGQTRKADKPNYYNKQAL